MVKRLQMKFILWGLHAAHNYYSKRLERAIDEVGTCKKKLKEIEELLQKVPHD